jgi:hypothetical protein
MLPTLDSLIDKFASKFRIETEIIEEKDTIHLHTYSYLGSRLLYEHTLDLSPLIEIAVARASAAAHAAKNPDSSQ